MNLHQIHATNAWNPTGRNLLPVPDTRLFYVHAEALTGQRTFVLLGNQQHLTFVADLEGFTDPAELRSLLIDQFGLYPHLVDLEPRVGLPRVDVDAAQKKSGRALECDRDIATVPAEQVRSLNRGRALSVSVAPVVAIDLGGTKALAGVVDREGRVRSRVWLPSREFFGRPAELLDRLAESAVSAATEAGLAFEAVPAIGVCVPGPLDSSRSVVAMAPNLGWVDLAVRDELERRLPTTPVFIENDVRAAALSEHTFGAGRGYDSMLAVFVGSGVGGGLVVGRRVYHGAHGGAGEIGHMVVRAGGPRCGCGRAGYLEAMAARDAVARSVCVEVGRGHRTVLTEILRGDLLALTSRDLRLAIEQSDAVAIRAARRSARYTGLAIGGIVNLLDPAVVVIGGGIAEALGQPYVEQAARTAGRQIVASAARGVPILASELGDDAGLLGAAMTAFAGLATG